jgi:NTE family protein
MRNPFKPTVALVLGGGGARGLAHLGVLKALEAAHVPIDLIVGCSAGAMVGTVYAFSENLAEAEERFVTFTSSPQFNKNPFRDLQAMTPMEVNGDGFLKRMKRVYKMGMFFATNLLKESYIDTRQFKKDVNSIVPDEQIENARIKLAIIATDLKNGEKVVMTRGSARSAVQASSAIAGVFPPVLIDGRELVDGGFVSKVPVETAVRLGADVVIAVDVSFDVQDSQDFSRRGTAISSRASAIMAETLKNAELKLADVVIHPDMATVHWADFANVKDIIPHGEKAAREVMDDIRKAMHRGVWRRLLWLVGWRRRRVVSLPAHVDTTPQEILQRVAAEPIAALDEPDDEDLPED